MRATVKLLNSGKVTVPATIRDELDLEEGDPLEIDVREVEG